MMTPKTKREALLEVEQEATIESPFDYSLIALAVVVTVLLAIVFMRLPLTTEPETSQPFTTEANNAPPNDQTEVNPVEAESGQRAVANAILPFKLKSSRPASVKANKALIGRVYAEVLNNGNQAVAGELFAVNFRHHGPGLPVFSLDPKDADSVDDMALPDLQYSIEQMVAEGDRVVTYWRASSTHAAASRDYSPLREQNSWVGRTLWHIADGQITEAWTTQVHPYFNPAWQLDGCVDCDWQP